MQIYTIESFILICTCWGLIALERFIVHLLGAYCPGTLYRSPVGGLLPWDALTIQLLGAYCPGMLSIQRA